MPNFSLLACLEVARLVRLARSVRSDKLGYARLVRSSEFLCKISAS